MKSVILGSVALLAFSLPALAQSPARLSVSDIDFGEDSVFGNDGKCADPRFSGKGMAPAPLSEYDLFQDGADCLAAYEAGTISLIDPATARDTTQYAFEDEDADPLSAFQNEDGSVKSVNELIFGLPDTSSETSEDEDDEWDLLDY